VFDEIGDSEICPICFWEDDIVQLRFASLAGGANKPSLIEAQQNFIALGACEERFQSEVRKPTDLDQCDPYWRTWDEKADRFEKPIEEGETLTPYPEDSTVLYYWRETYWRRTTQQDVSRLRR